MKCFYHSADLDGHCSGAIVKRKHPDCKMIGIDYGDPFPWDTLSPKERVFMVDFSLQPFSDMQRLAALVDLVWIDHHKTAIADAESCGFVPYSGIRDVFRSGCELTWAFCYPHEAIPRAVFWLGRYDIWKHAEHPGCLEFQYGMRLEEDTRPENQAFWNYLFQNEDKVGAVRQVGELCLRYERVQNAKVCAACAFEITFDGLRCIAKNQPLANSQTFASVYDPAKHDAMLGFYLKRPGQWTVSLYADKPDVDVSQVAKARGGGGHKGAAGFQCETLPW